MGCTILLEQTAELKMCEASRCRANSAQIRQSRPDSGLGFQVKFLKIVYVFPLGSHAEGLDGPASGGLDVVGSGNWGFQQHENIIKSQHINN